jgi:MFS family permease
MKVEGPSPLASVPRVWPFKRVYYGWAIVIATFVVSFGQVPVFGPVLGVFILPMQEELGWSRATIALGFTIGSVTGSITTFIIGSFLDRYGARITVVSSGVIITVAMLGLAMMDQPWQLWTFFGMGRGAALAGIQVGTGVALANWFIRKRGRAMAIKGMGLRIGQATFPLIIFAIMAASSWRHAYLWLAGLTFVCIVVPSALYIRRRPEDMGLHPDGMAPDAVPVDGTSNTSQPTRGRQQGYEESWTLTEARKTRALWLLTLFSLLAPFALGSLNLHMVANFQDAGISHGLAVSVLSIYAATSSLTVLPWGFLVERVHVRYASMLMCAFQGMACVIVIFAKTYPMAVVFGLVFGIGQAGWTIIQNLLFSDYFGRRHAGAIRGFTSPFRLLGPFGPVFSGYVRDVTGSYTLAFQLLTGVFVIMFMILLLAVPPKKGQSTEEQAGAD